MEERINNYISKNLKLLPPIIDDIIKENPEAVKRYRLGNTKLLGFFMGQITKKTKPFLYDPNVATKLLKTKLKEDLNE